MSTQRVKTLITGGKIVDGSGNPWFLSDIIIENDIISEIDFGIKDRIDQSSKSQYQVIGATGKIVCPGFIDIHSHSDIEVYIDGAASSSISQGITTEVIGNCGDSAFPLIGEFRQKFQEYNANLYGWTKEFPWTTLDDYFHTLDSKGISVNIAGLVGHASVRTAVSGYANRKLTLREFKQAEQLLREAFNQGAFGMSLGLVYAPGIFADTNEIIKFGKIVADYNGFIACHLRDESDNNVGLLAAIHEMLHVARKCDIKMEISHLKCAGPSTWGFADMVVRIIEAARMKGLDVTADQYPYVASCSSVMGALIPRWAQTGTERDFSERLKNSSTRKKIKDEVLRTLRTGLGPKRLFIGRYPPRPEFAGKSLAEISCMTGWDVDEVPLKLVELYYPQLIQYSMIEEDLQVIMKAPFVMVGSDGRALSTEGILSAGPPHPRSFGTFPRVISKYVFGQRVLNIEDAIRKMTSMPAQRLNIQDRGYLKKGFKADIVIFDPEIITDNATFDSPRIYPSGIDYVLVNGQVVINNGKRTNAKPGMVLRHSFRG